MMTKIPYFFKEYSSDYYPQAECLVSYTNNFIDSHSLNIHYNADVTTVEKNADGDFKVKVGDKLYLCNKLIVAVGLLPNKMPNVTMAPVPNGRALYTYETMPLDPELYKNKRVVIIGGGNAAFEVANYLNAYTNTITMYGADKFGWRTHYPGHIRSVNMQIIDSYYLKLNVVFNWCSSDNFRNDSSYHSRMDTLISGQIWHSADFVIYACGFHPNLPFLQNLNVTLGQSRFPLLTPWYESVSCPNLYFAGSLTQNEDYKKGTSAFIHGFRYNCRFLLQYLLKSYSCKECFTINEIAVNLLRRLNTSSALLHRFDYYCDTMLFLPHKYLYIEHIPVSHIHHLDSLSKSIRCAYRTWVNIYSITIGVRQKKSLYVII